jgi:Tfp pilus assembly protein PilV
LQRFAEQQGFTILEALAAALVLAVGLLGALMMLVISDHASQDVRAREAAVTLARQITESAREIPYSQINGSTIVGQLQAMPGLANQSSGSTWTISRSRVSYTVTVTVPPAIVDPKDTTGVPDDIKQVTANVSWTTFQGKSHTVTETTTLTRAGQDPGLVASGLQLFTTGTGVSGTPTAPVITSTFPSPGSLQFQVTAPSGTNTIVWTVNGAKPQQSWGATSSNGTTWVSGAWSLPAQDGTYTIGAQAEDAFGVDGPTVTIPVRLIRTVPPAPTVTGPGTGYGFNPNLMVGSNPSAELQWRANSQLNVVGYRIYNPSGTRICQTTTTTSYANCGLNGASVWCSSPTACIDLTAPATSSTNLTYKVVALYYDANNNLQESPGTSMQLAGGTPVAPQPPTNVIVSSQPDGSATLTWTPPSAGPTPSFYRVYRGGSGYTSRYDTVQCSQTCTYQDASAGVPLNSYFVSSVGGTTPGANMAESTPIQAAG